MKRPFSNTFILAAALIGLGTTNADAKGMTKAEVDRVIKNSKAANANVAKTVPKKSSDKAVEDYLDKAETDLDNANKDLETAKATKNPKRIKDAEAKVKTAQSTRNIASAVAQKNGDAKYGAALTKRRKARKDLEFCVEELQNAGGKEARTLRKRLREALKESKSTTSKSPFDFTMNREMDRTVAMNASNNARVNTMALLRGGRHCH